MADEPWADLEEYAEAMLKAQAEREGRTLRSMGILSRRRQAHIRRYEVPLSSIPMLGDLEDENA